MKKQNRGVTLIALIITIIVLLILAGITLNMVIGDSGIIKKARSCKRKNRRSTKERRRKIIRYTK